MNGWTVECKYRFSIITILIQIRFFTCDDINCKVFKFEQLLFRLYSAARVSMHEHAHVFHHLFF